MNYHGSRHHNVFIREKSPVELSVSSIDLFPEATNERLVARSYALHRHIKNNNIQWRYIYSLSAAVDRQLWAKGMQLKDQRALALEIHSTAPILQRRDVVRVRMKSRTTHRDKHSMSYRSNINCLIVSRLHACLRKQQPLLNADCKLLSFKGTTFRQLCR